MKWSLVRLRLRYIGLATVAVVLVWFVVGGLWPRPLAVPGELLAPTGPLLVGRTSYHWVDDSSTPPDEDDGAKREVMVHVWYPAKPSRTDATAPYFPGFATVQAAVRRMLSAMQRVTPTRLFRPRGRTLSPTRR